MSRKKDVIETEEKWKDGYEAVEVGDAEEEEGLSPIATTSFPCSVVKELCGLLHSDMARPNRRTRVLSDNTQVLTTLHCYSTDSFQWAVGWGTGLSQPTVSKVINGVTQTLCKLSNVAIIFTTSQQQFSETSWRFTTLLAYHRLHTHPYQSASSVRRCLCQHGTFRLSVMLIWRWSMSSPNGQAVPMMHSYGVIPASSTYSKTVMSNEVGC